MRGREAHLVVWEGSRGKSGGPGGVRRPTQRSGRHTQRAGRRREANPEGPEGSGGSPRGLGGIEWVILRSRRGRRPTRRPVRGREDLPEVWEGLEAHPVVWKAHSEVWEGSGGPPGGPEGPPGGPEGPPGD